MFEVQDLKASYGEGDVLHGISLKAETGKVTALVGRNGAGKSSTLKAIMGLIDASSQSLNLEGKELAELSTYERVKAGIGYVPQGREIFKTMTVRENLQVAMEATKQYRTVPEHIYELFPILKDFLDRKGGDLSGGQQQQLAIARALLGKPKVLILDEPTEGIQPNIIQDIGRIINSLKEEMTVLIVEQYLEFILDYSDEVYLLEKGEILMSGPTNEVDVEALKHILAL